MQSQLPARRSARPAPTPSTHPSSAPAASCARTGGWPAAAPGPAEWQRRNGQVAPPRSAAAGRRRTLRRWVKQQVLPISPYPCLLQLQEGRRSRQASKARLTTQPQQARPLRALHQLHRDRVTAGRRPSSQAGAQRPAQQLGRRGYELEKRAGASVCLLHPRRREWWLSNDGTAPCLHARPPPPPPAWRLLRLRSRSHLKQPIYTRGCGWTV